MAIKPEKTEEEILAKKIAAELAADAAQRTPDRIAATVAAMTVAAEHVRNTTQPPRR